MPDYLGEDDLLDLGIDPTTVALLLRDTPHSGHGNRPIIPANELQDRIALIERETSAAASVGDGITCVRPS